MGRLIFSRIILIVFSRLTLCASLRLIDFELQPTTTSTFTCTNDIATGIEMAAENCLLNQCTDFVSVVSLSYSSCTAENNILISGGVTAALGSIEESTIEADTCIKNRIESDDCQELFLGVIPTLSSISYISAELPELTSAPQTVSPTASPTVTKPVQTQSPVTSAPVSQAPLASPIIPPSISPVIVPTKAPLISPSSTQGEMPSMKPSLRPIAIPTGGMTSNAPNASPTNTPMSSPTGAPINIPTSSEGNSTAAIAAVGALSGVSAILLGYLLFAWIKKRKNGDSKSNKSDTRPPLDTTDTAFDNDEDPELGNKRSVSVSQSDQESAMLSHAISNDTNDVGNIAISDFSLQPGVDDGDDNNDDEGDDNNDDEVDDNNDSLVPEEDELSSGSSTLFDVNEKNPDYDDANSSVFYESQGEEDDDGEGTELDLDGTWGPDESSAIDDENDDDDDNEDESMPGSTISSLGASGVENFGENPSSQQFMEWIKKSPLIPAAAKASIVAAANAEAAANITPSSPATLPNNFDATVISDASGRQSW